MSLDHQLSPRKELILRALVEEYVRTAEPVASRQLSDQLALTHSVGYGSATVRSELATLEEEGYIYQPHVSAGRMPTDLGYRYFVERLMGESQLSLEEQRLIRHQFYQVQHQLDEWVRLTASVMAQALQSAAIITPPRGVDGKLKHFELLLLYDTVALLVAVLHDGTVRQERLLLDAPTTQNELSRLTRRYNDQFGGGDADMVRGFVEAESQRLTIDERLVLESLFRMLSQRDVMTPETFYHDGIVQLLQHDDFSHGDPERIRRVVEVLERSKFLPAIAPQVMAAEGVQVIIGGENAEDALKDMSVVVSRYGVEGQISGVLGIVGPRRMQYGRAIAVVRYMTEMLNDLLSELY